MTLLSIVVPTHNRADYAISCIESVLTLDAPDIEVIVADTSTDMRLFDYLNNPACRVKLDSRLRYLKIDAPSNLTKNHNDAVAAASGDYIIVIGDDDGITQAAIDAARWARANSIPAISHTNRAVYAWPDFRAIYTGRAHAGRLYVPRTLGGARWRSADADLDAALKRAFQATEALPRCYHGLVSRELMLTIKDRTGAFFHGSSPDMSGAIALAAIVDRYVEVDLPLSIAGISGGSGSGRSALKRHVGELSAEPQTSSFLNEGWISTVPRFFSVETVWAHAGLAALQAIAPDRVERFNYARLFALCAARHPSYVGAIEEARDQVKAAYGAARLNEPGMEIARKIADRAIYIARRMMWPTAANGRKHFSKLKDIKQASDRYNAYVEEKRFLFDDSVKGLL